MTIREGEKTGDFWARTRRGVMLAAGLACCPILGASSARAQDPPAPDPRAPSPLALAHGVESDVQPPDTPRGRARLPAPPRPAKSTSICSSKRLICAHAVGEASKERLAELDAVLAEAVSARRTYDALGLPTSLDDGLLGGGPALDIYLLPAADLTVRGVTLDPPLPGTHDRSSAFISMTSSPGTAGCARAHDVARHVAAAALAGLDAAAHDDSVSMLSTYWANHAVHCPAHVLPSIDAYQRYPERPLLQHRAAEPVPSTDEQEPGSRLDAATTHVDRGPTGAFLFAEYLDDSFGRAYPTEVATALFAASGQRTSVGAAQFENEPDFFDALRLAARDRQFEVSDLLLDFAVHRAFVGSRSDGLHLRDSRRYDDAGRVRFEWNVPFSSLPRRLAPMRPINASGATYLWLDLKDAPPASGITFVADWELPTLFRWALVKVGKRGEEVGRITVAGAYGKTQAVQSVRELRDLSGLLVVGTNIGDISRRYPFDPDDEPFEPHGYTVTFHKQGP